MASLGDLADLIAAHRANADKLFNSEVAKLRLVHGDHIVGRALRLAEQRAQTASFNEPAPALPPAWR